MSRWRRQRQHVIQSGGPCKSSTWRLNRRPHGVKFLLRPRQPHRLLFQSAVQVHRNLAHEARLKAPIPAHGNQASLPPPANHCLKTPLRLETIDKSGLTTHSKIQQNRGKGQVILSNQWHRRRGHLKIFLAPYLTLPAPLHLCLGRRRGDQRPVAQWPVVEAVCRPVAIHIVNHLPQLSLLPMLKRGFRSLIKVASSTISLIPSLKQNRTTLSSRLVAQVPNNSLQCQHLRNSEIRHGVTSGPTHWVIS